MQIIYYRKFRKKNQHQQNDRKNCNQQMSCVMRKPTFCMCENKGADQLRSNYEADQHLCFPIKASTVTVPLLCLWSSVCVGPVRKTHCWFSHDATQMKISLLNLAGSNSYISAVSCKNLLCFQTIKNSCKRRLEAESFRLKKK